MPLHPNHPIVPFPPIAAAMIALVRRGYSVKRLRQDALSALIVSLIALPLSMALSIAVGLPPQHGIYTAIVAGILAPLLGGSMTQVSGPTAAFVVIVAPIVATHGLRGLILAEIMAGLLLVLMGLARLGRLIHYIPYPVTTGFTAGIGVVLATLSLNDFLGLSIASLQGSYVEKLSLILSALPAFSWPELCVGMASLTVMAGARALHPKLPSVVLGVMVGTLLSLLLSYFGFSVATIGSRFSFTLEGVVHSGIPPFPPVFHWFSSEDLEGIFAWPSVAELSTLFMPALVIAVLAALESLLSATVADSMAGTKHHPNSELVGIGLANIACGFASGVPATGAIARTATNIHNGGRTPISSALHAVFILLYVLLFAPLIAHIPMASLAALLLITSYHMSHHKQFLRITRSAARSDVIVLWGCFLLTVFIDMVAGVIGGMVLASFLFIQQMIAMTEAFVESHEGTDAAAFPTRKLPPNTYVFRLEGPLFFGTIEKALERSSFTRRPHMRLIIDLERVPFIDLTGVMALATLMESEINAGTQITLRGADSLVDSILHALPDAVARAVKTNETSPFSQEEKSASYRDSTF